MKQSILKITNVLFIIALMTTSCSSDDDAPDPDGGNETGFIDMESDWVRLSLIKSNSIELMQADRGEIKRRFSHTIDSVETNRFYTSDFGRYLTVIDRTNNVVRFLDSGIENHDDHGHVLESRWLDLELTASTNPLPTHYGSSRGHMVIFNDGNGSFTHINVDQLVIPGYTPNTFLPENTVPHHGAGFRLQNGTFAITYKKATDTIRLPQRVKFIDANGAIMNKDEDIVVNGIHGNAVNGEYGAFGSRNGVILVDTAGNQSLIPNLDEFNADSGNWLSSLVGHDNANLFFARAGNLGVYTVDPESKTITSLYTGNDVKRRGGMMFNFNGSYLIIHTTDNRIRVYDANSGVELASRVIEMANIPEVSKKAQTEIEVLTKMDEPDPVLTSSDKFLYVLAPNQTQIKVLEIESLRHVHTIELDAPVMRIVKNGFSLEGDQNPDYQHNIQ